MWLWPMRAVISIQRWNASQGDTHHGILHIYTQKKIPCSFPVLLLGWKKLHNYDLCTYFQGQKKSLGTAQLYMDLVWGRQWEMQWTKSHRMIQWTKSHRMIGVGRDFRDHLLPTPLQSAGMTPTRPGCLKPHPTWPGYYSLVSYIFHKGGWRDNVLSLAKTGLIFAVVRREHG